MEKKTEYTSYLQNSADDALFNYRKRKSSEVKIGKLTLGGEAPIRIQSMANTDTNDTESSVAQCIRIIEAGGELVRFTAQGVKEATNLNAIHTQLREKGYQTPLVADIHFNPKAADTAAQYVEKVRINPGNFIDSVHTNKRFEYTNEEYKQELDKIRTRLLPFLQICKEHHTAVRIGVNHGSLSDRILSRYGDTPHGMVESCMEFLRICKTENFNDVVISIKASNSVIMVQTVRLLSASMQAEGMSYPLHLGVTEAGDGEDGRIKSAVGIGALLADGIGDTIRVSLSEDPECEIPVAKHLASYISERAGHEHICGSDSRKIDPFSYHKRDTEAVNNIGGTKQPIVIAPFARYTGLTPDYLYCGTKRKGEEEGKQTGKLIMDFDQWEGEENTYPLFNNSNMGKIKETDAAIKFLETSLSETDDKLFDNIDKKVVLILKTNHKNGVGEQRAIFHLLLAKGIKNPVVIKRSYNEESIESLQIKAGADCGLFFIDGLGDGIWIDDTRIEPQKTTSVAFGILQAARVRVSKTEFISCPSCGRTLFDLQSTIAKIKARTSHLKGLKIGIMGCIVNGPGEMADADYGYVGSAKGKVNLYKGQTCIEKLIPEEQAVERLIQLIKENGDWTDK